MKPLKNVFLVNGLTSGATGLILMVFAPLMAELFASTNPAPYVGVGAFLSVFAALVLSQALAASPTEKMVMLISILDITWVVLSVVILLFQPFDLSFVGYLLIAGVAAWVALMAVLQLRGLKNAARMQPGSR